MGKKRILIDTNIFVDYLRNHKPAIDFFENFVGKNEVFFSAITETELLVGKENDNDEKREKLLHFLYQLNKIKVDNPLVLVAGDIGRTYKISVPDAIIAATAITNNLLLITKNVKDFKKISDINLLSPY